MARIRVRARAVDMLGRQQIAGIPTAIHELFKNAYDAYADHVRVDFYRADGLLLLRDDGLGMTRVDFENRWLTLGTESKVGANLAGVETWTGPRNPAVRPITGEKGIGRLAIAAIGPQVLVMTRAVRPDGYHPLVISLLHWGLFEIPGIDLDLIDIPIEEITDGALPDGPLVARLASRVRDNVLALGPAMSDAHRTRLLADLDLALIDPSLVLRDLPGPSLRASGYGTYFLIRPTNPVIADDIDSGEDDDEATPLEKVLLGFGNTMLPESSPPALTAEFWDHLEDGTKRDVIGDAVFFTPEEFASADHEIDGRFDEFGHFSGTISVYHQPPRPFTVAWPGASGRHTDCGPFHLRFAYVQGSLKDSRLPPDAWAALSAKLNKIGGLYIYRNGIRILPYGNSDYDFLGIERRRTKSAQDWFFSYRRILGAVEITHDRNGNLVEKAGREGFRTNRAYREFADMLENLFKRMAVTFFRPTAQLGEEFNTTKAELNREAELLKKRERSTRGRRDALRRELERYFRWIERGEPSRNAEQIRAMVTDSLEAIRETADPDRSAEALLALERDARDALERLTGENTIVRPRGVGLSKALESDWSAYLRNAERIRREVIEPASEDVGRAIDEAALDEVSGVDRRRRLVDAIENRRSRAQAEGARLRREVTERSRVLTEEVVAVLRSSLGRLQSEMEDVVADVGRTDTAHLPDDEVGRLQRSWEERADQALGSTRELMEALRDQLSSLTRAVAGNETLDATTAALETRVEALQDQLDAQVELAQAGMAVGIVQHEFANTVRGIRSAIRQLKPWADVTPDLAGVYGNLKNGFDHLDGYLNLFTPLSRRLNRTAVPLSGEEIRNYLLEVFGDRLLRRGVKLRATPAFDGRVITVSPASVLPAFVNLVDNAIFWLGTEPVNEPTITLDADDGGYSVSNNGPGIPYRIADRIFEFGESAKPGGRGMGLHLSRQALQREGIELELKRAGENVGPEFRILFPASDPLVEI